MPGLRLAGLEHATQAVGPCPPERIPVLVVVVGEQRHVRVGADVREALEPEKEESDNESLKEATVLRGVR